ncbi:MAG: MBL fold metallo-hydrolase [Methanocellales archaeon]|nr:MBL fold metallo-hydrolase [Methanocellales archaeon]MDD3290929.1 MBL fold metallo-hydrolase [Methanocellales archaeon]MDD3292327.1 MBL fold metallo-hydrolase [Methanocellales archaeon]MDD5234814.1 MBL fold metallo-hydrolase [Methanocellales archaeon]MDD5484816.1 MBL fold metallo-hydrolase [Methanocellales archaeon]
MAQVHKIAYNANSYLIAAKRPILVDVGMHCELALRSIEKIIAPNALEYIVLTHCHYDHTFGALELAEQTGARIAIHENDAELLGDDRATVSDLFGVRSPNIKPDVILQGGEILNLGDVELEVIHTPGHTPGGICLYGSKQLFSGDTIFPNGSVGRTDLEGGDSNQLIKSIKLLTTLDVETLYPGHGDVTNKDVNAQIRDSLRFAEEVL